MQDTQFLEEIRMQPGSLRDIIRFYRGEEGAALLARAAATVCCAHKVVVTGMGTSLLSSYLLRMETVGAVPPLEMWDAGELVHFGMSGLLDGDVLLAISQSGESAETKAVVAGTGRDVTVVSIVNDAGSFMGGHSHIVLPLCAGKERSISTMTYTNTLALLLTFAVYVKNGDVSGELDNIERAADLMERNLEDSADAALRAAEYFGTPVNLHCVARGSDLVAARQFALILKEGTGIFTEALSAGQFRHGPVELTGPEHVVACFVSQGNMPELTAGLADEIARAGSRVLMVTDSTGGYASGADPPYNSIHVETGGLPSRFFSILCAPFIEYCVHILARSRGRTAGEFRYATKITSRE